MKTKIAMKNINADRVYQCGYCALQSLLPERDAAHYNAGAYGWNCDIFYLFHNGEKIAITTGYRNMRGERISRELCEKYEELTRRTATVDELEELRGFFLAELSPASNEWASNFADLLTCSNVQGAIETVVNLMDDDLREELNGEIAPCAFADFCGAYAAAHYKKFGEIWEFAKENPCF